MAKNNKNLINGYFFMSVIDGEINVDCSGQDSALAAAFATIIVRNNKKGAGVKSILTTAVAIAAAELENEKYSSKKSNKLHKTVKKEAKKK
jgi:hypothetical protein